MTTTRYFSTMTSPFGSLVVQVDASGRLQQIVFCPEGRDPRSVLEVGEGDELAQDEDGRGPAAPAVEQLREYFAGERRHFDLDLAPRGSGFQQQVWRYLTGIPFGETRSYGEIAEHLGRPGAARAVGRANATNPIPIVVPCHRVVGADGSLTGYVGGLAIKQGLLELEGWRGEPGQLGLEL
ncbi:MAG: methylated-DNA--[protein]-cysteine S-methyltransferase [Thermoanaerobaculia bacterium]